MHPGRFPLLGWYILDAYHGLEAIRLDLKGGLNHWQYSEKLLETLRLLASKNNEEGQGEDRTL
jgi:hypothetical protein